MQEHLVFDILFMAVGIFAIIASIANWDLFLDNSRARLFLKLFGRNGARIFYAILGMAIFLMGLLSVIGVSK